MRAMMLHRPPSSRKPSTYAKGCRTRHAPSRGRQPYFGHPAAIPKPSFRSARKEMSAQTIEKARFAEGYGGFFDRFSAENSSKSICFARKMVAAGAESHEKRAKMHVASIAAAPARSPGAARVGARAPQSGAQPRLGPPDPAQTSGREASGVPFAAAPRRRLRCGSPSCRPPSRLPSLLPTWSDGRGRCARGPRPNRRTPSAPPLPRSSRPPRTP